jgi:hypothetical protein
LDDDTTVCRRLGVYGVDKDFAVFKTDRRDLVVDFLIKWVLLDYHVLQRADENKKNEVEKEKEKKNHTCWP